MRLKIHFALVHVHRSAHNARRAVPRRATPMTNVTELVAHHFILFLGFHPSPPGGRRGTDSPFDIDLSRARFARTIQFKRRPIAAGPQHEIFVTPCFAYPRLIFIFTPPPTPTPRSVFLFLIPVFFLSRDGREFSSNENGQRWSLILDRVLYLHFCWISEPRG